MSDSKGSVVRTLVIILVVIIVDVVGGYFIGTKIIIPMLYKNEEVAGAPVKKEEAEKEKEKKNGNAVPVAPIQKSLEPINLNPAKSGGEIFSCQIVLEAAEQPVVDEVTLKEIAIRDKISTYLSFKTVADLNDPSNWETFRKEMTDIVNSCLTSGKITSLLIPQKIIQFY